MTHWIVPERLATKMSVWNTSHSIGAGLAIIFCGDVVSLNWGAWFDASSMLSQHWRWCFLLPATIALLGAAVVWAFVRDTPSSVGLPELKTGKTAEKPQSKAEEKAEYKAFLRRKVFLNPTIWIIAVGNFFVYIVRFAVLDWGPTMPQGAPAHGHQPCGLDRRGVRNCRYRGHAGRRLGHRPFLRRPCAPHVRHLDADGRRVSGGTLIRSTSIRR